MGVTEVIVALAEVTTQALILANIKVSRKYIDKLHNLKIDLLLEEEKGYDSDDARIEHLHKEIKITSQTAMADIQLAVRTARNAK